MANTYTLIETVTASGGTASSIAFSSIPQSYTDLKLVLSGRSTIVDNAVKVAFNGSSSNFTNRLLFGNGDVAASNTPNDNTVCYLNFSNETTNAFANSEIYITNYTGSTNKSFCSESVQETNAVTSYQVMLAGLWSQTAAITSITLTVNSGAFAQHTSASLYGIKSS
jgi:hypothetical protein